MINYLYLPSTVLIAQVLVGPSKQLKQIIQTEHYIVKNSNWPEANRLALYKRGQRFELGARKWSERDSNLGSLDCVSDALTTRPRCLPKEILNLYLSTTFRLNSVVRMKPAHFESRSCGGAWHRAKIVFVEEHSLISWFLANLGDKVLGKVLVQMFFGRVQIISRLDSQN